MSVLTSLEHFFKSEVRKEAGDLLKKKLVFLQIGSDTQIDASVRGTTQVKVAFRSHSIESATFTAGCSCKASSKGQLCKHIWAVLLAASEKSPDFFECKTEIEKAEGLPGATSAKITQAKSAVSPGRAKANEAMQERQAAYRKQAYENQKQRAKNIKSERKARERGESIKGSAFSQALPDHVKAALAYFELNGLPMTLPVDEPTVGNAKRILSRVFHPDKGGTNDEMLELLRHADALVKFRL